MEGLENMYGEEKSPSAGGRGLKLHSLSHFIQPPQSRPPQEGVD